MGAHRRSPSLFCTNLFFGPFSRTVSFPKRYQFHQIGTPPPSGQSRHHRLPLVLPYPSTTLRGLSTSPTSHPDSFHSFILWAGFSSPNRLSYFRFGQTRSETKTADRPGELLRLLTRSCFLLLVLGRLFLLALPFLFGICPHSRWSPPLPLHALALIPLSLAKVRLSLTLTLSPLMIWYSGLTALFLFLLARAAPAFLPTALSVALWSLFPFQQAQYVQVFSLKPAPFCTLSWSQQHQQVCHFSSLLLSDSRSVLATLSSPPSFLLSHPGSDTADELARRGALLAPSAIPCSLSPLISRIHSCLFSDWRRTVSSKYFDTQVSSISAEELLLPRHARCVLSRLPCNGHSLLLGSYLTRIGRNRESFLQRLWTLVPGHPHLILHCPATDS